MLRLALALLASAVLCLPVAVISDGDYLLALLLSPIVFLPAPFIAPDVFLRGEYPRMRRRR
jgi:hypothetical protein